MSDSGLDWEWTRTQFRKTLLDCANANAINGVDLSEGLELFSELHACSLLMLNFKHRISSQQQRALRELAAACDFSGSELRDDPEWDEEFIRGYLDDAVKHAQASTLLLADI